MTEGNNPAFPTETNVKPFMGLTKREWFAGMAINGILSYPGAAGIPPENFVEAAYEIADAMIKHGEKS